MTFEKTYEKTATKDTIESELLRMHNFINLMGHCNRSATL